MLMVYHFTICIGQTRVAQHPRFFHAPSRLRQWGKGRTAFHL